MIVKRHQRLINFVSISLFHQFFFPHQLHFQSKLNIKKIYLVFYYSSKRKSHQKEMHLFYNLISIITDRDYCNVKEIFMALQYALLYVCLLMDYVNSLHRIQFNRSLLRFFLLFLLIKTTNADTILYYIKIHISEYIIH